jgi:hypothetical protein
MSKLIALLLASLSTIACVSPLEDTGLPPTQIDVEPPTAAEPAVYPTAPVLGELPVVEPLAPIRVWVSPDVSEQEGVRAAVDAWAQVTEGVREWVFVEASAEEIADADEAGEALADVAIREIGPYGGTCAPSDTDGEVAETTALGCVWGIGGLWNNESGESMPVFLINTSRTADGHAVPGYQRNAKLVTMHEIGHLLGLTHAAGGLMTATTNKDMAADWECPDAQAVDALASKLKVEGLHACALPDGL